MSSAVAESEMHKDMYHHIIPRFILRQFNVARVYPGQLKPTRQAFYHLWKGHKKGAERVFAYDVASGVLREQPIARVYGQFNLYRNPKDTANVDYLEDRLADLEQETSYVLRAIHLGIPSRSVTLSRAELATLRKFIFLMHYRNDAVSSSYFHENNPVNAPLAEWIKQFKKSRQLKTEVDVWREGLKYYLETPHQVIVASGERLRERYGDHRLYEMLRNGFDPEIEDWYAVDYESQANYFFLGIWEAADETEFVLGGNTFGLWEGLIYGSPGAHRLYVVSPRIALVLRRTFLRQRHSNDPSILYSSLANIPITPPVVDYADIDFFDKIDDEDDPAMATMARNAYRMRPVAQKDTFRFSFTKLTTQQTYAVNEVAMMNSNLDYKGSLTFASPKIMLRTLDAYMNSHNTFLGGKRTLFHPLHQALLRLEVNAIVPNSIAESPPAPPTITDTDADHQLNLLLRFTVLKRLDFPSNYNRAFLIFHMATDASLSNAVTFRIRKIRDNAIARLRFILDPPLPDTLSTRVKPAVLVETLPKEESELFFGLVGYLVDQLDVGNYSNDFLANIIYEAAILGVAYWLAEERTDVLQDILHPWVCIYS